MEAKPFTFRSANGTTPLTLSSNFILPKDRRPLLSEVLTSASIPIIDMSEQEQSSGDDGRAHGEPSPLVQKISQACEEFGFFQIINHGVPRDLCRKMMTAVAQFFQLPPEERAQLFSEDPTKPVKILNYNLKIEGQEKVSMWSESFSHPWDPVDDFAHLLPTNPPLYKEVVGEYAKEIGALVSRLLRLLSRGLGLEEDCLQKRVGERPRLRAQANMYPPCPDPEQTLGLAVHTDLNALTVLLQSEGVSGLQVIKDGKWVAVDPVPNAFVINLGDQIQVLSNGRYKSVHHRAVTNKKMERMSLAMFYGPNKDTIIGPIEDLVDEEHPPLYRSYHFAQYLDEFFKQMGTRRMVKEVFELRHQGLCGS
ncbi:protein DMR6-LIKE OXYGENASE 1-like [Malania oleifera]|uniref:protein DMR6-LIKE OXYGENASE 1-like n=1 Tax=Malania oleifera TaxID=397392 RepID=UPI0025AE770B|nr:protein DMR6-LIKE OXYGENASE 1-like [Malania oleifera]